MSVPPNAFELPRLYPKEAMQRNELCWCQSGKKWKNCHRDREAMEPVNMWKVYDDTEEEFQKGYCLHPEASPATCTPITQAHTIQKRGGLISIAEENHVLSVRPTIRNLLRNNGKLIPCQIGINKASTFPGFCNKHDAEMFREAETGDIPINSKTAFLLSYRAVAREFFNKESALRAYNILRESDRGKPFSFQVMFQQRLHDTVSGIELGKMDGKIALDNYARIYHNNAYDDFRFYALRFDDIIPVVSCGAMFPEYDFEGNAIQVIPLSPHSIEHVAFNLTVLGGASVVIFGWLNKARSVEQLVTSFERLAATDKANAAVRFAFEYIENTFVRPSWWSGLDRQRQDKALEHVIAWGPSFPEGSRDVLAGVWTYPRFVERAIKEEFGKENLADVGKLQTPLRLAILEGSGMELA